MVKSCSEQEAVTTMMMAGETRIIGMVTVAFKNHQVTVLCDKCREMICQVNANNLDCGIMTDENAAISLHLLMKQEQEVEEQSYDIGWNSEPDRKSVV